MAKLYESRDGRVECEQHVPDPSTDTFRNLGFLEMAAPEIEWHRAAIASIPELAGKPLCEICRAIELRNADLVAGA